MRRAIVGLFLALALALALLVRAETRSHEYNGADAKGWHDHYTSLVFSLLPCKDGKPCDPIEQCGGSR